MKTETSCLHNIHRILLPIIFLFLLSPAFSQRISELPPATYMGIGDLMPIVQNGVTKKLPFTGLAGSLSFLQDSLFFSYGCINGSSKWYFSGDTIFLDTCFVAGSGDSCLWDINGDTIFNKNRSKVKFTDSVYFSNYVIPKLDSNAKFMGFLTLRSFNGNFKQLAYSTIKQAADSLAVNFDTLSYFQKISDTTLYDATRNWVRSQNYLTAIPSSVLEWSDTTATAGVGIATYADLRTLDISNASPIVSVFWDGRGGFVGTGFTRYKVMPFAGTIVGWSIVAIGTSPTCTIDIWRKTYATSLPTVANTIMGTKPALSSGNVIRSSTLTNWSPLSFSAGDIFGFNIDASSNATWISITLEIQ